MSNNEEYPKYIISQYNIPLRKPKGNRGRSNQILFQSVEMLMVANSTDFIPTWDDTDHFHFCCQKCESMAEVLEVQYYQPQNRKIGGLYSLYISLRCPVCGATGKRKIIFNPPSFMNQQTVTEENSRLFFARDPKAIGKKQLIEEKLRTI